jgi:hypothetical protein
MNIPSQPVQFGNDQGCLPQSAFRQCLFQLRAYRQDSGFREPTLAAGVIPGQLTPLPLGAVLRWI